MFVQNLSEEVITFKKGKTKIEIKPAKVKYISEIVVSAKELKEEFGNKIAIYSLEDID